MIDSRRRERLRWRCRRGMLELDLILVGALERHCDQLDELECAAFERLLESDDTDLLGYFQDRQIPPEDELRKLVTKLRQ